MSNNKLSFVTLKSMLLSNNLPKDFIGYAIAGKNGRTLAHVASAIGTLPSWFKDFHIADDDGVTVGQVVANRKANIAADNKSRGVKNAQV